MDEVRRVIFSIDPDSALGPDGFCSRFYQSCWDIICCDLLDVVLDYSEVRPCPGVFRALYSSFCLRRFLRLLGLISGQLVSVM